MKNFPTCCEVGACVESRKAKIEKTVEQIDAELWNQVVAEVAGKPVTKRQLYNAFEAVADKKNWKMPINAPVVASKFEREVLAKAIEFFTGSKAKFVRVRGGQYIVKAEGYYAAVGA